MRLFGVTAGSGGNTALELVHRVLLELTNTLGRHIVLGGQVVQGGLLLGQPALVEDVATALVQAFQRFVQVGGGAVAQPGRAVDLQSPLLRSATFISFLLTPLSWTMWVSALDNTAFSFSTWGLVSLMALVGAVLVEQGLDLDFELACSGESALRSALQKAATPILFGPPTLDTGSLRIPNL